MVELQLRACFPHPLHRLEAVTSTPRPLRLPARVPPATGACAAPGQSRSRRIQDASPILLCSQQQQPIGQHVPLSPPLGRRVPRRPTAPHTHPHPNPVSITMTIRSQSLEEIRQVKKKKKGRFSPHWCQLASTSTWLSKLFSASLGLRHTCPPAAPVARFPYSSPLTSFPTLSANHKGRNFALKICCSFSHRGTFFMV